MNLTSRGVAALAISMVAGSAASQGQYPQMLQWFELEWRDMEHRVPDFFLAGYRSTWLPPISSTTAPASAMSPGYDPMDRFDLDGSIYGTEEDFKALVDEFHQANALVNIDLIMNHNGFRRTDEGFHLEGGYSGFWANPPAGRNFVPTDDWGDFHNSFTNAGYLQSTDPGGSLYDLFKGDLVALCDINQFAPHVFIRQPVDESFLNIPAGTIRNKPDAENARFYPDTALLSESFTNPGTFRNSANFTVERHPWNPFNAMNGDPVLETAGDYLVRHTRWLSEQIGVDGYRLDAAKHIQSAFWDLQWDNAVYNNWEHPSGEVVTAYSFGESTSSNGFIYDNYIRKPNNNIRQGDTFGNRDTLDLSGAGSLRNLIGAGGFGSWQDPLDQHFDNADGFNDGSLGVNHVFSHDNGSFGDGGSVPADPSLQQMGLPMNVYVIMRPGQGIIYHNELAINRPAGNFSPRNGLPLALGRDRATGMPDDTITKVVRLATEIGRGDIDVTSYTDPVEPNIDDVFIFERRTPGGPGNSLIAVNDRRDPGFETRNVATNFAPGTRLHEQTGNAADPMIDPTGQIPEVITVGANSRLTINVPNNVSTAGAHEKGFLIYSPALPTADLTITNVTGQLPSELPFLPLYKKRLNQIDIVEGATFELQVATSQTDPLDNDTDDNALFKFNSGYEDLNGNGIVDFPVGLEDYNNNGVLEFPVEENIIGGFEQFVTENSPTFGSGGTTGLYRQTIDASLLDEGLNYITINVFRHRDDGGDPLYRQLREVIYLDNEPPGIEFVDAPEEIQSSGVTFDFRATDRTTVNVVALANLDPAIDAVEFGRTRPSAVHKDRFDWDFSFLGLTHGTNTVTVVAYEESGKGNAVVHEFFVNLCPADVNKDGIASPTDFTAWINAFNNNLPECDQNADGSCTATDFTAWIANFNAGCP